MDFSNYADLGFANTKEMFHDAFKNEYAVPGYNANNMEQIQAVMDGCADSGSPVIIQISRGAREYANEVMLKYMIAGYLTVIRAKGSKIPVAMHLDHGDEATAMRCIDEGYSSVMIDASAFPFDENIAITKRVVEKAHKKGVVVEGELGTLAGIEEDIAHEETTYTRPEQVQEFVERTGVDSLAIAIGTSHGAYKFPPDKPVPPLRFDILEEVEKRLPDFPIVLHGSSSVPQEYVAMCDKYGGELKKAVGVPEEQLRKAAKSAVCKINIDTDGRLVLTAVIRKVFAEQPEQFDPRKYLGPARAELMKMITRKNKEVLGSAGRY